MNFKLISKITGRVLLIDAACMLLPMLVALIYGESPRPFLMTIGLLLIISLPLSQMKSKDHFFARDGFFTVGLIWVLISVFGSLPFWFCGHFPSYVDCLFESISGFTTTGASILTAVEGLPRGILFWRSFMHWLGGMGVLVLTVALLPSLGARSQFLTKAEASGPISSKLVPKMSQSSKILYGIYCALTLIEVVCLLLAGMPLYDSIVNSFATGGTGGFSVLNDSIAGYESPAIEVIIAIFMVLFSINFAMFFLALSGRVRQVLQSDELRFFLGLVVGSTLLIALNINGIYQSASDSLRYAFFQVSSVISTTGFATADFNQWPEFSRTLLMFLGACGGCAGSTAGGLKCSRVVLALKGTVRELSHIIHPRSVKVVKLDGRVVEESTLASVHIYFTVYLLILVVVTMVLSLDDFSFGTTVTAAMTTLNNVGPGLEMVGPMGNFSLFSPLSKLTMSLAMIIGRLEIFPILVLFSRNAWELS